MNWEEACRILGIPPTASEKEIYEQYRYKVQILHPDGNLNKPVTVRERAEEELKQVNRAYNVLKESINNPFSSPPKLDISLRRILFKEVNLGQKKHISFVLKSVGGPYSKIWIDDNPASWLRVINIKSLTSELLPLEVTIEANGNGEPNKHYACSLAIRLENEQTKATDEAIVRVELWMNPEAGTLKVEAKRIIKLWFVEPGAIKKKSFQISNIGPGLLKGHLFTTRPWLAVSPYSVTLAPSSLNTYTLNVDTNTLGRGFVDKGYINIITNGGNDRIPVELSMALFSLKKLYHTLFRFVIGFLLALVLIIFVSIRLPADYWVEPIFSVVWVAFVLLVVVSIFLAHIGGFIFRMYSRKTRQNKKISG